MKTLKMDEKVELGLSRSMLKILTGLSAEKAKVVERMNLFHFLLNLCGCLYISQEELGYLYFYLFYLPGERQRELKSHLDEISSDFLGWKKFHNSNKYGSMVLKKMAVKEMIVRAAIFEHAQTVWEIINKDPELKNLEEKNALKLMKRLAVSFEEKTKFFCCSPRPPEKHELEELLAAADSFSRVGRFLDIPKLPARMKNQGLSKMFRFAKNFQELMKVHKKSRPGSPLRKQIVAAAKEHEVDYKELFEAYYAENWNNLKRMLFKKIRILKLGIEDWLNLLSLYGKDRKLKDLGMRRLKALGLTFQSLNNSLGRVDDSEIKLVILEEMYLLGRKKDFSQWKIICDKSGENNGSAKIFRKAFARLVAAIKTPAESVEACALLVKNKNKSQARRLLHKIMGLEGVGYKTLEDFHKNSDKEIKMMLLPMLRSAAAGDFQKLERVFELGKNNKIHRGKCLADMYAIGQQKNDINLLIRVYKLALSVEDEEMAETVIGMIRDLDCDFLKLVEIHDKLGKEAALNNGLDNFLQKELIRKAETTRQKKLAFDIASLENKSLALGPLLLVA